MNRRGFLLGIGAAAAAASLPGRAAAAIVAPTEGTIASALTLNKMRYAVMILDEMWRARLEMAVCPIIVPPSLLADARAAGLPGWYEASRLPIEVLPLDRGPNWGIASVDHDVAAPPEVTHSEPFGEGVMWGDGIVERRLVSRAEMQRMFPTEGED